MRTLPVLNKAVDLAPAAQACCGVCRSCMSTNIMSALAAGTVFAGDLDEVERVERRRRARKVADERDAGFERADDQRLAAVVVVGDRGADLGDSCPDLGAVEEDLADPPVDFASVTVGQRAQDAFC